MAIKVGINGYGRIGRNILRAAYQGKRTGDMQIVAINDLGDANTNAHLTRYDTVHGKFPGEVKVDGNFMVVNGDRIRVLAERDPAKLPWGELGVDFVLECTGLFTSKAKASAWRSVEGGTLGTAADAASTATTVRVPIPRPMLTPRPMCSRLARGFDPGGRSPYHTTARRERQIPSSYLIAGWSQGNSSKMSRMARMGLPMD